MKRVIHIFGASGSGTSILGRALAEKTGFRFMDTDDYYWLPAEPMYTLKRPIPERLALMARDLDECSDAVLSGSLAGWGDPLIPRFTLAVRLVTPTPVRMERLKQREYARYGRRILPGGDLFEQSQAFLAWAAQYDDGLPPLRSRALHDLWQQQLPCPLLTLDGTLPLDELAEAVLQKL
ncbi:MAG: shikimate kinase [Clostridia bacterium]|nr:shikimate kinase [Clostridia bacterium]MBR0422998.1 shikimate kinase [Clostridia bacterium]